MRFILLIGSSRMPSYTMPTLELTAEERTALVRFLRDGIDRDRFPLSPRLAPIKMLSQGQVALGERVQVRFALPDRTLPALSEREWFATNVPINRRSSRCSGPCPPRVKNAPISISLTCPPDAGFGSCLTSGRG